MDYSDLDYQEIFDLIKESENPFMVYCKIHSQFIGANDYIWDNIGSEERSESLDRIISIKQEMDDLDSNNFDDSNRYLSLAMELEEEESLYDSYMTSDRDYERVESLYYSLDKVKYATLNYLEFTDFADIYDLDEVYKMQNISDFFEERFKDFAYGKLSVNTSHKILLDRINDDSYSLDKIFTYLSSTDLKKDEIMDAVIDRVKKYECAEDYDLESLKKSPDRLLETMRGIDFYDEPLVANNDFCK